jgi:hypothetical protein
VIRFLLAFVLFAPACTEPHSVSLAGVVYDSADDDRQPAPGIEVSVLDGDLALHDQDTSDEDGAFSLRVAAAQDMFLELRGAGKVTTLFAGEAGVFDMTLEEGALYVLPEDRPSALAAEFGACADDEGGGVAEGVVRAWIPGTEESDESLVGNAWVVAYDADNEPTTACYLDADGAPAPEDQDLTNETGRFAIFGLEPGPYVLEVSYRPGVGGEDTGGDDVEPLRWYYKVNMVEGGVAPFYPAWVEI